MGTEATVGLSTAPSESPPTSPPISAPKAARPPKARSDATGSAHGSWALYGGVDLTGTLNLAALHLRHTRLPVTDSSGRRAQGVAADEGRSEDVEALPTRTSRSGPAEQATQQRPSDARPCRPRRRRRWRSRCPGRMNGRQRLRGRHHRRCAGRPHVRHACGRRSVCGSADRPRVAWQQEAGERQASVFAALCSPLSHRPRYVIRSRQTGTVGGEGTGPGRRGGHRRTHHRCPPRAGRSAAGPCIGAAGGAWTRPVCTPTCLISRWLIQWRPCSGW
ncbi:hypothetical protein SGRIM119S_07657 [Streptomyces griseorubiginosus]